MDEGNAAANSIRATTLSQGSTLMVTEPEYDFVEYEIDVENGAIVDCRAFGEGKQADPLDEIKVYKPSGQNIPDWWVERLERHIRRAMIAISRSR